MNLFDSADIAAFDFAPIALPGLAGDRLWTMTLDEYAADKAVTYELDIQGVASLLLSEPMAVALELDITATEVVAWCEAHGGQ